MDCNLQDCKGEMIISKNEKGALKVERHYNPGALLTPLPAEDSARHRVDTWWRYSPTPTQSAMNDPFNRSLKLLFLMTVGWSVMNILIQHLIEPQLFHSSWICKTEAVLLILFAAVILVAVFVKMMMKKRQIGSAPQRKEEVKTNSALVQHV